MAMVLNVRELVRGYGLPPALTDALLRIFDRHVQEIHSRTRLSVKSLSALTQERRTGALCKAFVELRRGGFEIQSPWSLKEKHVRWLVQHWVSLGQGGGTIENKLTYLRALASWIGKKDLVGTLADYVDRKEKGLVRSYVAIEDKSWIGHGITAAQKIEEIGQTCPYVAVQLKLQAAFGLRVLESFMLRPLEAARNPQTLGIDRGTKGGRPREVPIQERINVLEEAARLSNGVTGSTVPADRTLKQWRDWYYYVLEKHGVTKSGLGFTSHGLRHQWAHELYETVTGTPAPIKRSDLVPDAALHEEAQRRVAEAMGHSRITKANAYLSTLKIQQRLTRPPAPSRDDVTQALDRASGNKTHAAAALGISRPALYRILAR
ncbi:integrase domain-containing protein [Paraburkholderia megapolitana]|uniref:Regulatory protein, Fis family n=1 Tax=Paraburkholderia megapolitana TaxID=420953 RepID=A0A1I3W8M5_9BURK|nr:integrase domain-containing protein [Paraburkholderia megapolitana]SFK03629.1 regulatory protein, Fis family [Paraburkholderia megapolitana]